MAVDKRVDRRRPEERRGQGKPTAGATRRAQLYRQTLEGIGEQNRRMESMRVALELAQAEVWNWADVANPRPWADYFATLSVVHDFNVGREKLVRRAALLKQMGSGARVEAASVLNQAKAAAAYAQEMKGIFFRLTDLDAKVGLIPSKLSPSQRAEVQGALKRALSLLDEHRRQIAAGSIHESDNDREVRMLLERHLSVVAGRFEGG